jgi:hypothetical protein
MAIDNVYLIEDLLSFNPFFLSSVWASHLQRYRCCLIVAPHLSFHSLVLVFVTFEMGFPLVVGIKGHVWVIMLMCNLLLIGRCCVRHNTCGNYYLSML